jgi:IS66 Orf2 like protein
VIGLSGTVRVLVATKPVDFRKGAEGLAALVREQMQADPFSGAVYVFRAKRADRVKLMLGRHGCVSVCQAAGGWQVSVAGVQDCGDAVIGGGALGLVGGDGCAGARTGAAD